MDLHLTVETGHGWYVLHVVGDVDVYSAHLLHDRLQELFTRQTVDDRGQHGAAGSQADSTAGSGFERAHLTPPAVPQPPGVVIDVAAVDFMDSAGLGVLVAGHRAARRTRTQMRLAGPNHRLVRMLAMTGLSKVLAVYPEVSAAVAAPR